MPIAPRPPLPSRRTWQRRSAARPTEIRAAALALFAERGYGGATIEDIARAAAVTVGTVYRYFTDKSELLASLVDWAAAEPLLGVPAGSHDGSRATQGLRDALGEIWAACRRVPHGPVLKILVAEAGNAPELVARYRGAVLDPASTALARLFAATSRSIEPLIAARAALGQLLGASLLAGSPTTEPLVAQLDPRGATIESIVQGALGLEAAAPPDRGPRPIPVPAPLAVPPPRPAGPPRPYVGPDSW